MYVHKYSASCVIWNLQPIFHGCTEAETSPPTAPSVNTQPKPKSAKRHYSQCVVLIIFLKKS